MAKWTPAPHFWESRGLPSPVEEFTFFPGRKWRFDFAWPHAMVAVEIEGSTFAFGRHSRGFGALNDSIKYNEAARLGWKVYKFIPEQMATDRMIRPTQIPKRFKGKIETTSEFLRSILS